MARRRIEPLAPMLLLMGIPMLFPLVPIILAVVGIKVQPWPGMLVFCVFLLLFFLVPVVHIVAGIELGRTRTLIGVVCFGAGSTLIFAFGWHWGVRALVGGGLLTAAFVFNARRAYARLDARRVEDTSGTSQPVDAAIEGKDEAE